MSKIKSVQFPAVGVLGGLSFARVPEDCARIEPGKLNDIIPGFFLYPKGGGPRRFVAATQTGEVVLDETGPPPEQKGRR